MKQSVYSKNYKMCWIVVTSLLCLYANMGAANQEVHIANDILPSETVNIQEMQNSHLAPTVTEAYLYEDDAIEIVTNANVAFDKHVDFMIEYTSRLSTDLKVTCMYKDTFGHVQRFHDDTLEIQPFVENKSISYNIELPDDIVYYDYQNVDRPTNFYVKNIEISVLLTASFNGEPSVVARDTQLLFLPSPWNRKDRPTYCENWLLNIQKKLKWKYIPTCPLLADSTLFPSVLSFAGNEGGYTRKVKQLNWPSNVPTHVKMLYTYPTSRFTLTFWVFFMKDCTEGLCMILQHRNASHFFSPLILLNSRRNLHIQFETVDGRSHAFTSAELFPLKTWIHVMLTVDVNIADLYIMYDKAKPVKHYHHVSHVAFDVNITDGVWAVGGYSSSNGFKGFLWQVKLYQNTIITFEYIQKYLDTEYNRLKEHNLNNHFRVCSLWKAVTSQYVLKLLRPNAYCLACAWWEHPNKIPQVCPLVSDTIRKEIDTDIYSKLKAIRRAIADKVKSVNDFAKMIYGSAMKEMMKDSLSKSVAARLFELSGCLGHANGYFTSATMYTYGLGITKNTNIALLHHLLSSQKNGALSQLALAYRYQLGVHGSPKDIDIMSGYLRQAAITTKKVFEQENHEVHTQSELIRLDQAHLFRDVRGSDSELFKWLSQQAKMGSSEARTKVAEMLFYGKQGVNANRAQAVDLYEQGAVAGDANAIYNLGVIHLKGLDVEKNNTKAFEYFRQAAEMNSSAAFNSLGYYELMYSKNRSGAAYYWKKAADLESLEGMNNYAFLLEGGLHVGDPPDKLGAYEMFKKAANKGQMNSCIRVGDYLVDGSLVTRDMSTASQYYRFVAEQSSDVGMLFRKGIDSYIAGNWYKSLVHHLQATEAGIQLAGYNTALLLKEYTDDASLIINISDPYYFYNITAEMGWSLSLIEMGHRNWLKENKRKASHYYARSVEKDNNPEALFNLGYIVEHGYPLDEKLKFQNTLSITKVAGNVSIATLLYENCINTKTESGEGYYPCKLALYKLKLKSFIQLNRVAIYCSGAAVMAALVSILTLMRLHSE